MAVQPAFFFFSFSGMNLLLKSLVKFVITTHAIRMLSQLLMQRYFKIRALAQDPESGDVAVVVQLMGELSLKTTNRLRISAAPPGDVSVTDGNNS